jgi:hypothetical protein
MTAMTMDFAENNYQAFEEEQLQGFKQDKESSNTDNFDTQTVEEPGTLLQTYESFDGVVGKRLLPG